MCRGGEEKSFSFVGECGSFQSRKKTHYGDHSLSRTDRLVVSGLETIQGVGRVEGDYLCPVSSRETCDRFFALAITLEEGKEPLFIWEDVPCARR